MKHLDIEDILTKRKQPSHSTLPPPTAPPSPSDLLERLQELIKTNNTLHLDTKVQILHLIADKTGIVLNKSIVAPYLTVFQCHEVKDLTAKLAKGQSIYVLSGEVREYCLAESSQNIKFNTQPPLSYSQHSLHEQDSFETLGEFQLTNQTYTFSREVTPMTGIGKIFKEKPQKYPNFKVVGCEGTLLVVFARIDREDEFIYGWGLNQQEKLQLVKYFPVLTLLGKKLNNFINNFNLKQFNFKDLIYKKGEAPCSVYFVIEGEVNFQLVLDDHSQKKISTGTVTANNYFGEEEILFKGTTRSQTAKVRTSRCTVLELSKEKFEKLLENTDFAELVLKTAKMKEIERNRNIEKARRILIREREPQEQEAQLTEEEVRKNSLNFKVENRRKFSTFRNNNEKIKIMHGNVIREIPEVKDRVEFSMLHVNPDHYAATKDKYRQYLVKKTEEKSKKPWDFRKLWKVLNLQDVLSENEIDIGDSGGRKFFDSHRRLQHQLLQTKSVRPKTTSSNYRTKMQYIAYLQQFNQ